MITCVPLAVPAPSTSRQLVPNTRSSPAAVRVHCWLVRPWQSQRMVAVPAAVFAPVTSRQRPEPAFIRPTGEPIAGPVGTRLTGTDCSAANQAAAILAYPPALG